MRWQGIVEVHAAGDTAGRGSGYRIAAGLVLTARGSVGDRIAGLNAGADGRGR